jgi:hypothetical protein
MLSRVRSLHEKIMENVSRNSTVAFNPGMELDDEFEVLREARRSLGGNMMKGIEIDMDILADAYPQEAKFMSAENVPLKSPNRSQKNDSSPKTPLRSTTKPGALSARKTPMRRFFKSENEREYARNLMKELVQIYILQGVHGKQAFRDALNETRRRIFLRRGEDPPSPPPVTSPAYVSPYPKLQQPLAEPKTKITPIKMMLPPAVQEVRPVSEFSKSPCPVATGSPSRVKNIVAAINSTPKKVEEVPAQAIVRTPGSAKIKAVVECIEATVAASTPGKRATIRPTPQEPVENYSPPARKTRATRQKVEATPVSTDTTKSKRRAEKVVSESETDDIKKDTAVSKKKREAAPLESISEAQESSRPSRRAKVAANESLIKK